MFADIIARSRGTGHHPSEKALHPWFPGSVSKSTFDASRNNVKTNFCFNLGNQGWHYAWQSHRMTCSTEHELHIFILAAPSHSTNFTCMCELSSPPFDMHYRRKRNSPSPTKAAANSLMNFNTQTGDAQALVIESSKTKRSASEISSSPEDEVDGSISPKRQMVAHGMDEIMPSNKATASPVQIHLTSSTSPKQHILDLARRGVTNAKEICKSLHGRIRLLEERKRQLLKVQQIETPQTTSSILASTVIVPATPLCIPAVKAESTKAQAPAAAAPALSLLALCC
jgi:hypothetical protein